MQPYRYQYSVREQKIGRVPAFVGLVLAALLVPVLLVAGLVVSGLLLMIGAGAIAVAMVVLLVAGWRQKQSQRKSPHARVVDADYRVVKD